MVLAKKKVKDFRILLKESPAGREGTYKCVLVVHRRQVVCFDKPSLGGPKVYEVMFYQELSKKRSLDFNMLFSIARKYHMRVTAVTGFPVRNGEVLVW